MTSGAFEDDEAWQAPALHSENGARTRKCRLPGHPEMDALETVRCTALHTSRILPTHFDLIYIGNTSSDTRCTMEIRFYLCVFPMEALIASQLPPLEFGTYMATGTKNGSFEKLIFVEIESGFGDYFDWAHAAERCVPHASGDPKHSVWMSVYRVLEHVPLDKLKSLYLATNDGRTLELPGRQYSPADAQKPFYVYQELCPVHPLVVSTYDAKTFSDYMTHENVKVAVPTIAFADLKVIDFDNLEDTGNIGSTYDRNLHHLRACIESVTSGGEKKVKNVERSRTESFGYQIIDHGIFVGSRHDLVFYPMPTLDEIRMNHYDWGKSALIV